MIWLSWRQHRTELLIFGGVLVCLAAYLLVSGMQMYASYTHVSHGLSVALCEPRQAADDACPSLVRGFTEKYSNDVYALRVLDLLPLLAGMFIGAPLVARDRERGTFKLAWTQGITRGRWLSGKLAALVGFALLASVGMTALVAWWRAPFHAMDNSLSATAYVIEGIVPVAYMLFALALGVAAGALLGRIVPAMFVTLAGFFGATQAIAPWRLYFMPPLTATWNPNVSNGPVLEGSDWIISMGNVDKMGHYVDPSTVYQTCMPPIPQTAPGVVTYIPMGAGSPYAACLQAHGWLSTVVWQPADRYWTFQGIESAIFAVAALALLALAYWWVRRHVA